ncbi:MAG: hypothetical protein WCG04_07510, partial [Alphaproteobacteria bacterium]
MIFSSFFQLTTRLTIFCLILQTIVPAFAWAKVDIAPSSVISSSHLENHLSPLSPCALAHPSKKQMNDFETLDGEVSRLGVKPI